MLDFGFWFGTYEFYVMRDGNDCFGSVFSVSFTLLCFAASSRLERYILYHCNLWDITRYNDKSPAQAIL